VATSAARHIKRLTAKYLISFVIIIRLKRHSKANFGAKLSQTRQTVKFYFKYCYNVFCNSLTVNKIKEK
jgi:hypothetical protein